MDMMQGISGIQSSTGTSSSVEAEAQKLGRDDFLTLFLTQLKNQDPLSPMESQEFSSQLAQFSSLEQLFNVNEVLQAMKTSQDDSSRLQALDFIGKEIVADGSTLSLEEEGENLTGYFDLQSMADCTLKIKNEQGFTVRSIPLGTLDAGSHSFEWDGRDSVGTPLDPGLYNFEIVALNASGSAVRADTRISGTVTGVNLEGTPASLYVGAVPVSITQVRDIRNPESIDTSASAATEGLP